MRLYLVLAFPVFSFLLLVSCNNNSSNEIELQIINPPTITIIDGKNIAVYELHIKNRSTKNISLVKLEIKSGKDFKQQETFDSSALKKISASWNAAGKRSEPGLLPFSGLTVVYLEVNLKDPPGIDALKQTLTYRYIENGEQKTSSVAISTDITCWSITQGVVST